MTMEWQPVATRLLIAGEWLATAEQNPVYNPANTTEIAGWFAVATREHVQQAIQAARTARRQWADLQASERAEIMLQAAQLLDRDLEVRSLLLVKENGKVLADARRDAGGAAQQLRLYAQMASQFDQDKVLVEGGRKLVVHKQPVGVVGIITPWNYPVVLAFRKIAPALLAGNCLIVKPASTSPLALTKTIETIAPLFPPGVLNLITGPGNELGAVLAEHDEVGCIGFTGSTATGQTLMQQSGRTVKKLSLELGGNDAALILDDLPVTEGYMDALVRGVFTNAGQVCFAIKRIYVPRQLWGSLVEAFMQKVDQIVIGNGLNPQVTMGPVNNRQQYQIVNALIDQARWQGARISRLGKVMDHEQFERGYFIRPTVITDVDPGAEIVVKEQFGPAIPLIPYQDPEEAIAAINDSEYGLCSSIWTSDQERGFKLARRIEAGITFINEHSALALDPRLPFGGLKQSGLGRESDWYAVEAYYEPHGTIVLK